MFVTGTDTGAGKTVAAAAICAALAAQGLRVVPHKPALTGLDEEPEPGWPRDDELLAAAAGLPSPEGVAPLRFGPAVSPHLAAELAGVEIKLEALCERIWNTAENADALVVEGVGGLLVPFSPSASVRDLAAAVGLPVVVAARPGLGTISHTLLTLEAARAAGLHVAAVVMTPWPPAPSEMEQSNRATVASLGDVEVAVLPRVERGEPGLLARAGAGLRAERWLGEGVRPRT